MLRRVLGLLLYWIALVGGTCGVIDSIELVPEFRYHGGKICISLLFAVTIARLAARLMGAKEEEINKM